MLSSIIGLVNGCTLPKLRLYRDIQNNNNALRQQRDIFLNQFCNSMTVR